MKADLSGLFFLLGAALILIITLGVKYVRQKRHERLEKERVKESDTRALKINVKDL